MARDCMMWTISGVLLWSGALLLVNGDLASFALFGVLLFWAVAEMVVINRQDGKPPLAAPLQSLATELPAVAATLGLYGAVAYVHGVLSYPVHG